MYILILSEYALNVMFCSVLKIIKIPSILLKEKFVTEKEN